MITEIKRDSVRRKIDLFLDRLDGEKAEALKPYFYEIMDSVLDETQELQQRKVEASDMRELIIEVREGFRRMDERFEYFAKRFEMVDKRFEQVDKRFEQVDKRFEQVDARFNRIYQFMMWMMGVVVAGFFGLYLKLFFTK
ncbi:MAG: hypothetical protein LDLANPLL_02360 [Turneriella sp.]|nr:hypothetical protein [Turneriella sp.]